MALKNTSEKYGGIAIGLHWLMAIMIMTLIVVGLFMTDMDDGAQKWQIYGMHKATGFVVLLLALFRWYWTLTNAKPRPLEGWSVAETAMAHAFKWLLMLMILIMPVSGAIMSVASGSAINVYGLFSIPGFEEKNQVIAGFAHDVHEYGAIFIAILVIMHILAGLKHHLIKKDDTLNRMMGR